MCAAVADWRAAHEADRKQKKDGSGKPAALELTENPDILAYVAQQADPRPSLVIGFAAETDNLIDNATKKRLRKGCDWLIANDVSQAGVMGGNHNTVHLIRDSGIEAWPQAGKQAVADRLMSEIIQHFQ